jgi:UDP-N-acetylglucosamine--N-acetylmuramyl-(pentapeptide) pyrophosphoryl-undecaprenol N-acetylglucosamine transferase
VHERRVVVFSGGGTGGHLYPALAIADAVRELRPEVDAFFVGATRGIESRILPERGEQHMLLPVQGIDRTRPWSSWRALPRLIGSLRSVVELFHRLRPEAVVVTGGYAGAPAGLVAGLMGIPLVLQEQNSVPGVSTRLLSRFATAVHVAFPEAQTLLPRSVRSRVRVTGNPVRPVSPRAVEEARRLFDLPAEAFVVLVTGGSQGSLALNRVVGDMIRRVSEGESERHDRVQLLWSTGTQHFDDISETLSALDSSWVTVMPYIEDMPSALAAADLAVSRSGAMTTAEFLNQGLPAILVPLPTSAANHQAHNAEALADVGAAIVAPERDLTAETLWSEVTKLASDPDALDAMRRAALTRAHPEASEEIAAHVGSFINFAGGVA